MYEECSQSVAVMVGVGVFSNLNSTSSNQKVP